MAAAKFVQTVQDKIIKVTNCHGEQVVETVSLANKKMVYTLFQSECEVEDVKTLCFGIEVVSTLFGEAETVKITDITTRYEIAKELYDILCENLVTPVCVKDIVEDFLVQKYS